MPLAVRHGPDHVVLLTFDANLALRSVEAARVLRTERRAKVIAGLKRVRWLEILDAKSGKSVFLGVSDRVAGVGNVDLKLGGLRVRGLVSDDQCKRWVEALLDTLAQTPGYTEESLINSVALIDYLAGIGEEPDEFNLEKLRLTLLNPEVSIKREVLEEAKEWLEREAEKAGVTNLRDLEGRVSNWYGKHPLPYVNSLLTLLILLKSYNGVTVKR